MASKDFGYEYRIEEDGRVIVTYLADVTIELINEVTLRIKRDPKALSITGGISDFSRCTSADLSTEELESHLTHIKKELYATETGLPWALVAPTPYLYGISRQAGTLSQLLQAPVNYHGCKTFDEAVEWLDAQLEQS